MWCGHDIAFAYQCWLPAMLIGYFDPDVVPDSPPERIPGPSGIAGGNPAALRTRGQPAVELGSQPALRLSPTGAEHLEGFGSLEGAARAEGEMVAELPASGVAVINADDAYASLWRASTSAQRRRTIKDGCGIRTFRCCPL